MRHKVRPFSNGATYDKWLEKNCCRCALWGRCYARRAIEEASWFTGEITKELFERTFALDGSCKNLTDKSPERPKVVKIDKNQLTLF